MTSTEEVSISGMDDECSLLVTTMRLQDAKSTIGTFHLISLAELVALSIPTMVRAIPPPPRRGYPTSAIIWGRA